LSADEGGTKTVDIGGLGVGVVAREVASNSDMVRDVQVSSSAY